LLRLRRGHRWLVLCEISMAWSCNFCKSLLQNHIATVNGTAVSKTTGHLWRVLTGRVGRAWSLCFQLTRSGSEHQSLQISPGHHSTHLTGIFSTESVIHRDRYTGRKIDDVAFIALRLHFDVYIFPLSDPPRHITFPFSLHFIVWSYMANQTYTGTLAFTCRTLESRLFAREPVGTCIGLA
jgi:hypothetical protein